LKGRFEENGDAPGFETGNGLSLRSHQKFLLDKTPHGIWGTQETQGENLLIKKKKGGLYSHISLTTVKEMGTARCRRKTDLFDERKGESSALVEKRTGGIYPRRGDRRSGAKGLVLADINKAKGKHQPAKTEGRKKRRGGSLFA